MAHPRLPVLQPVLDRRELFALGVAVGLASCGTSSIEELDAPDASAADPDASAADAREAAEADAGSVSVVDARAPSDAASAGPDGGAVTIPPGYVALGPIADFSPDRWQNRAGGGASFIVGRDAQGVFVYSSTCTHNGCLVPAPRGPGQRSTCPCHGAVFDDNGARLSGPARGPLPHRAALVAGGTLYVNPGSSVDASTRTPV